MEGLAMTIIHNMLGEFTSWQVILVTIISGIGYVLFLTDPTISSHYLTLRLHWVNFLMFLFALTSSYTLAAILLQSQPLPFFLAA